MWFFFKANEHVCVPCEILCMNLSGNFFDLNILIIAWVCTMQPHHFADFQGSFQKHVPWGLLYFFPKLSIHLVLLKMRLLLVDLLELFSFFSTQFRVSSQLKSLLKLQTKIFFFNLKFYFFFLLSCRQTSCKTWAISVRLFCVLCLLPPHSNFKIAILTSVRFPKSNLGFRLAFLGLDFSVLSRGNCMEPLGTVSVSSSVYRHKRSFGCFLVKLS